MLLPWLGILALLLLKSNRNGPAWLIWLPLGLVTAATLTPWPGLPSGTEVLLDMVGALAFGLAAVWLLANELRRKYRLLTFLCIAPTLLGFSGLGLVSRQDVEWLSVEAVQVGIALGVAALVISLAMTVAGFLVRRRYRFWSFCLWLVLLVPAVWLVVAAPFLLVAGLTSGGRIPWGQLVFPVLVVAAITFAILLPFLVLSCVSGLFRERLKALLHATQAPPPLPNAAVEANLQFRC